MKKILILMLAVISFAACNQEAKPAPQQQNKAVQNTQNEQGYVLPGLKGDSYDFTTKISEKPVVVAFMAGFCGWCKKMIPYMNDLAGQVPETQADVIIAFIDESPTTLVSLEPVRAAKKIKIHYVQFVMI